MSQYKWFRVFLGIIMLFLIIYLGTLVQFIFRPIVVFVEALFVPFLLAGVLYYLFRPIVNLLHKQKLPKTLAIIIIYLAVVGLITLLVLLIGPILQKQVNSLVNNLPYLINEIRALIIQLQENDWINRFEWSETLSFDTLSANTTHYVNQAFNIISTNIAGLFSFITNVVVVFIIIPFILFYMLKEGEKAPNQVLKLLPEKQRIEGQKILGEMDVKLSSYIQGQILVSMCVGILMYAGFLIIDIEYSLILALVAMFTNVIPFVGPWIGTVPAVIVAIIHSPFMVLKVLIVIVVVQQFESNFISPQIMGKKLAVHPLTIILLLIVAGRFAGIIGMLLAVPTYAVCKVVVSHTYRLLKLRNRIE
ncbi:AI-2E family transporter [Anaerobacillus alkalidiazotrophicus]|uniref:AI-2E family transporter n=1 Tax=Anaerobacillus alkalidiazotrophicus TaxID=472963 RepID=A0A1S2M5Z5_9BACI|nr:AI-2E family transporter [Anaerobacillus alkalidiazotrophicus]OIJ18441.1 AI-2E family transporter [Anaerobacillus alkalidiazotrophicus]OIJ19920.1 AI-2E family transporter [Anaerobacillus alkalidiazotrophicus]